MAPWINWLIQNGLWSKWLRVIQAYDPSASSLLLPSLELSDTTVYQPTVE